MSKTASNSQQTDTEKFVDFLERYCEEELAQLVKKYPREKRSVHIDYDDLYRFNDQLAHSYRNNPSASREAIENALTQTSKAAVTDDNMDSAHVRVSGGPQVEINTLRASDVNNLITFPGVVTEASEPFPEIDKAVFECVRCGTHTNPIDQTRRDLTPPRQCRQCEKDGPFDFDQQRSIMKDVQILVIQENPERLRGGEEPSDIKVRVEDDLAGHALAGQKVAVTGELCFHDPAEEKKVRLDEYISGHDIVVKDETFNEMDITESEKEEIIAKSNEEDIYQQMIDSVAPAIYGHDDLKESIVLQMFSGVEKHLPDSRIRGDIHVLAIGDPGTGKSQILQFIRKIAPRAIYSQGKGSSSAGLTASCVKGELDDEGWTVKAGTLVKADRGVAAVDELDKMDSSDRSALHEGLEQGEVTVSKAGINTTLKSRCALLAAANPKYGRFDAYESVAEQIDLEPALISRFDLIFTVSDQPDPEKDEKLAEHILQSNYAGELHTRATDLGHSKQLVSYNDEALEAESQNVVPEIEPELFRKYIAYSKQQCVPELGDEARRKIKKFYIDLRSEGFDEDAPVPVTARKLEAMIRLAEASARVRLADNITVEDAERAITIVKKTLQDVGVDPETGELDVDAVEVGTSQTQRKRIKDVTALVAELEDDYDSGAPIEELLDKAEENKIEREKAKHELEKLQRQGEIYEPETDHLRTT